MHLLYKHNETFSLYQCDDGRCINTRSANTLDALDIDAQQDIVVALPGELFLFSSVKLPKAPSSQLRKILPFALEEQLTEDIDQLFFALGEPDNNNHYPVAVINKQRLEQELNFLQQQGIQPAAIIPDFLALPWEKDAWSMACQGDRVLVRTGFQSGFSIDQNNINALLKSAMSQNVPQQVNILTPGLSDNLPELDNIKQEITTQKDDFFSLPNQIDQLPINILQAQFRSKKSARHHASRWRYVSYAAGLCFAVWLGGNATQYFYYRYAAHKAQSAMAALYHKALPKQPVPASPKRMLENTLNAFNSLAQHNTFLKLMHRIAPAFQKNTAVSLVHINFTAKHLLLSVRSEKLLPIEHLVKSIAATGLNVRQPSINTNNQFVTAQLEVK